MKKLKELRKGRKITQDRLADIFGVSRSAVSMWETGASEPDHETILRLADFFNVTTDYLLGRADSPGEKKPAQDEIILDELEFALFGELRELSEVDKQELLRDARRMRELQALRNQQRQKESD